MNILKTLFKILEAEDKNKIYVLIFLSLIGMLLETVGIGIIMPLLVMLSQNNPLPPQIAQLIELLEINLNTSGSIMVFLLFMLGFFFIKFLFLLYLAYKQTSFVYRLESKLSTLMFKGYLLSPYTFHLQHNTTELIRNVIGEVAQFTGAVLALLIFITEIFVLTGILILLLFIEPLGAITSLLLLGLSGIIFDKFSKKYVKNWGFIRQEQEGMRLKHLNQGLNALKEIKISGTEEIFTSKFEVNTFKSAEMEIKSNILSNTPRLGLEFLAVSGIFILMLTLLNQGNSLNNIVPTIAIFGIAAFRIMPSINRIINTGQVVRYRLAVILMLEKEISYFKKLKNIKSKKYIKVDEIDVDDVSFKYPGNKKYTLRNINFKIKKNQFIGITGESGEGKSTFLSLVLGLLKPDKGQIKTNKINILNNITEWQNVIGYVPQDVYLMDDTIRNNIAFGLKPNEIDNDKLKKAIKSSALESFLTHLPLGMDTLVGEKGELISGGQKQRIGLARALYNQPQLLILDEATNALDIKTEKLIISNLKQLSFKPIILMITHREKSLSSCDHILEFKDKNVTKKLVLGKNID